MTQADIFRYAVAVMMGAPALVILAAACWSFVVKGRK